MKRTIQKSLSKLKITRGVLESALSQWDFENEELLTGNSFSDQEILELDNANLLKEEVYAILYDATCKKIGKQLAQEMAENTIARIKNVANYIRDTDEPKKVIRAKFESGVRVSRGSGRRRGTNAKN